MLKFSKLARSHTQCLYFVIILSIQRYAISNKRELHCVRADVFGDLKIYVSEALARFARPRIKISYFFSVGTSFSVQFSNGLFQKRHDGQPVAEIFMFTTTKTITFIAFNQ